MAGLTDLSATNLINVVAGSAPGQSVGSRWLGLFTTAPTSDSGVTGATEVSGGAYARVQIAGSVTVNGTTATSSPTLHVASVPAWIAALGPSANGFGVNVYDQTTLAQIGVISSCVSAGTTITLQANALSAVGATDVLLFSIFPLASNSVGSEPVVTASALAATSAAVSFVQSTASWGTVTSFGIFDAVTSGNLLWWDFLGAYKWSPFTCTSASPGVLTCTDQTFVNGQFAVVSEKAAGLLPTTGGSWSGILTVAGVSGATLNLGVNTTGTGDGLVRQVIQQAVAINTTVTFSAGQLTLAAA